jgi:hypothetical protein
MLEAVIKICQLMGMASEILVGITTDGETANTGHTGRLLRGHVGHVLITVWYYCC